MLFKFFLYFRCFTDWEKWQNQQFQYLLLLYLLNMGIGVGNVSHIENDCLRFTNVAGKYSRGRLNTCVYYHGLPHLTT